MKRYWFLALVTALLPFVGEAQTAPQAIKPTLMVVPSNTWCTSHGYVMEYDNQGVISTVSDYARVVQESFEFRLAASKIGELMAKEGFPLQDLAASLKTLQSIQAEEAVSMSKSGSEIAETPLEKLKRVAKADIWIYLDWQQNKTGLGYRSVTFNMQGIDAYTDKQITASSGTGQPSASVEFALMLESSVVDHMGPFLEQLQAYFDDMFTNGREVRVSCRRWQDSDIDFESEFNGDELGYQIEDWMAENTVMGRFSAVQASANVMEFDQVRIPLKDEATGRLVDARRWGRGLQRYLENLCGTDVKLEIRGLGHVILTIGGK